MKTKFLVVGTGLFVIGISIFFIYIGMMNYPNISHHKDIRPDYYSVLVTADFPSENTIQITQEGTYVL